MAKSLDQYAQGDTFNYTGTEILSLEKLGEFIRNHPEIKHFNLSNSGLKFTHDLKTSDALASFSFTIGSTLDLSHNPIGGFGVHMFFKYVHHRSSLYNLTKLNLSYCNVEDNGVRMVFGIFREMKEVNSHKILLEEINLSNNQLSDISAEYIVKNLNSKAFESLKILDISSNKMTFTGLKLILNTLNEQTNNLEVIFGNNLISPSEELELNNLFNHTLEENSDTNPSDVKDTSTQEIQKSVTDKGVVNNAVTTNIMEQEQMEIIKWFASKINAENSKQIESILKDYHINEKQSNELIYSLNHIASTIPSEDQHYITDIIGRLEGRLESHD